MLYKQLIELYEILDSIHASGEAVRSYLETVSGDACVQTYPLRGQSGKTDMVKLLVSGKHGKHSGGSAPTIGLLGRLGGLGARPERIGFVSDGDGALAVLAIAAKLLAMGKNGDQLEGDVFISTHVCPDAPTQPHQPVAFMGSPVDMAQVNREEVIPDLDAILCVDTTKGNRILNRRGFAISPTVKEGYILPASEDLLEIMSVTTGQLPSVFAISTQDITPYGNGLYHINSILQPATATHAPVVGVAITTETPVPGCATGASHLTDIEEAARFMLEAAKAFGRGQCAFYHPGEFEELQRLYGPMNRLQTLGNGEKTA